MDRRGLPGALIGSTALAGEVSVATEARDRGEGHCRHRVRRGVRSGSLALRQGRAAGSEWTSMCWTIRRKSGCATRFASSTAQQMGRRQAQLQQSGPDPPEPLPAWLGALPAVASRLSLRVRAGAAGLLPGRDHAVVGFSGRALQAGEPGQTARSFPMHSRVS